MSFCRDCYSKRHWDNSGGIVGVNNGKSLRLASFFKHQGSTLMKFHSHIRHDAPCPLPSTVPGPDLLCMRG